MSAKAEKLRQKMRERLPTTSVGREATIAPMVPVRPPTATNIAVDLDNPKPPRPRKCCKSVKKSPHEPTCKTLLPKQPKPAENLRGKGFSRLPDLAQFAAVYNDNLKQWACTLTIGDWHLSITKSGIHQCLMHLGQKWHKEHAPSE